MISLVAVEELAEWLRKAGNDLHLAKFVLEESQDDSAFHSQQAAEKALKAVFLKKLGNIVKTHELVFLAEQVQAPKSVIEDCKFLSQFFAATRYPSALKVNVANAEKAIAAAERVFFWSKEQI